MTDSIQHDLLGYLLDALEPEEREFVEAEMERDPQLRDQLETLRRGLLVLRDEPCEPPAGLAARTCDFVARERQTIAQRELQPLGSTSAERNGQSAEKKGAREPLGPSSRSWRPIDIAVALAVCVAGAALVFPWLHASRVNAQIAACANKLRDIGLALTGYSERHNALFPQVAESGNLATAGVYAPTLVDAGFLTNPRSVVCPGSPLAEQPSFRIPTLDEVREAKADRLAELRRVMGGSYGYALGYRDENGKYKPTRNLYRERFALVSDVPADDLTGSANHGRGGLNVLLEDGHVVYLRTCHLDGSTDDIFTNDLGQVAPGCHVNDAVIVRSDVSP
jgi:hypothetical protein